MVKHLGRLKMVTKRKESDCNYKFCSDTIPGNNGRILPGENVFLLTKMGQIGTRTTIFGKYYHKVCFAAWAMYTIDQMPTSKDGRIGMQDLHPEGKKARQRLVRQKAQLLRNLRTISPDKLKKTTDRIQELDREIAGTGYPVLQYQGRRSDSKAAYNRFWEEVKDRYQHPLRVPRTKSEEAARLGMGEQFTKDMKEWNDERNRATIERQGKDFETAREDKEVEY